MYSITGFGSMVADTIRMTAFARALQQAIRPSTVVLDIGCGTGIMSLLACKYGARQVYAIEPDDAIVIAQANAQANGYADRIHFFQSLSTKATLPEPADLIVSDLRGILPLFGMHIPAIIDARKRLLRPGGIQIAQSDRLWAAPVDMPGTYKKLVQGHHPNEFGVNLEATQRYTSCSLRKVSVNEVELLARAECLGTLDYTKIETSDHEGNLSWTVARNGTCHGIVCWFDCTLIEGVSFSNAPGLPELIYGQEFFPWPEPVPVQEGDTIKASIKANLVHGEYVWRWDSQVIGALNPGKARIAFQQSDFFARPLAPAQLRKRSSAFIPSLGEEGEIDRHILNLMDGRNSIQEIARQVQKRFPGKFTSDQEALDRVGAVSSARGR